MNNLSASTPAIDFELNAMVTRYDVSTASGTYNDVIGVNFTSSPATTINDVIGVNFTSSHATTINDVITANFTSSPATTKNRNLEMALVLVLTLIDLYLFAATLWYNVKQSQENIKWTNRLCTASALLLLLECFNFQSELHLTKVSDAFCNIYTATNLFLSTSNRTIIYAVFWIRQRSFYRTFTLIRVTPKRFTLLSNSLLAAIIIFGVLQVSTLASLPIFAGEEGCAYGEPAPFIDVFTPIVFFIIALFQVALLAPVLYPILRHIRATRRGISDNKLEKVAIRLSACTSACLVTDIIFIAVSVQKPPEGMSFSFIPILYSINMIINVVSMLASFADYQLRLFPFRSQQKVEPDSQQQTNEGEHNMAITTI